MSAKKNSDPKSFSKTAKKVVTKNATQNVGTRRKLRKERSSPAHFKTGKQFDHKAYEGIKSSAKTHKENKTNFRAPRTGLAPADVMVTEYIRKHGSATVKELAAKCFGGDYLKAKNAVRRPRWLGEIKPGDKRGTYVI